MDRRKARDMMNDLKKRRKSPEHTEAPTEAPATPDQQTKQTEQKPSESMAPPKGSKAADKLKEMGKKSEFILDKIATRLGRVVKGVGTAGTKTPDRTTGDLTVEQKVKELDSKGNRWHSDTFKHSGGPFTGGEQTHSRKDKKTWVTEDTAGKVKGDSDWILQKGFHHSGNAEYNDPANNPDVRDIVANIKRRNVAMDDIDAGKYDKHEDGTPMRASSIRNTDRFYDAGGAIKKSPYQQRKEELAKKGSLISAHSFTEEIFKNAVTGEDE